MSKPSKVNDIYQKIERLGIGTYSVVFKARNKNTRDIIALKKFITDNDNGITADRLREMAILKIVGNHPNIVNMLWYDNLNFKYFSMPIYEFSLKKALDKKPGSLLSNDKYEKIHNISYQLLQAVHYLHSYGICHRDIKPQNIMLDLSHNNRRIKVILIDLGLGRRFDCLDRDCTKTHSVCTLWYRSPEILLGDKRYSYEIDIWGVGCVLAEMLLSYPLFPGDSEIGQLFQIFKLLGTPDETVWNNVTTLSHYKMTFPNWSCSYDKKFNSNTCNNNDNLIDLLKGMIMMDQLKKTT